MMSFMNFWHFRSYLQKV